MPALSLDIRNLCMHALSIHIRNLSVCLVHALVPYAYTQNKRKNFKIERGHSEHDGLNVHIRIKLMPSSPKN